MSLNVPEALVEKAKSGSKISRAAFIDTVRESLPKAWAIVSDLFVRLEAHPEITHAIHEPLQMDDESRGQLLRLMASNAIRGAVEEHYGFVLAFQNCHKTGAFRRPAVGSQEWCQFVSLEAQVLNQSSERRNC